MKVGICCRLGLENGSRVKGSDNKAGSSRGDPSPKSRGGNCESRVEGQVAGKRVESGGREKGSADREGS